MANKTWPSWIKYAAGPPSDSLFYPIDLKNPLVNPVPAQKPKPLKFHKNKQSRPVFET